VSQLHPDARAIVDALSLAPHPEGGFFRETFRAPLRLDGLPHGAPRAASTAIYFLVPAGAFFLVPAGAFSAWHAVAGSDEVWHHYDGDPLDLHVLSPDGARHEVVRLGRDLARGERPQHVVPAGHWQAARPLGDRYALCGCTVAPGFDFADFAMPSRAELLARFPERRALVEAFTR
jgi:predicted cupin superfamily sugar epimerase